MRRRFFQNANNVSYMFIEALENDFSLNIEHIGKLQYCIDNGEYSDVNSSISGVNKGSRIYFVGYLSFENGLINEFTITKKCKIGGDIRSIIYGNDFKKYRNIVDRRLRSLFRESTGIVEVENGFLEGLTELSPGCYHNMFSGCTSLTTAPALPATTLATGCYLYMFEGCTSLVNAPELPATTLAQSCYNSMFYGCTSLTTAPELPATTLAEDCYHYMFEGCTSLTTSPELPATTLATGCYYRMFNGCTKLNYIKMLATNISASNCLYYWVEGVASTGTFVKNPAMNSLPTATSSNYYAGIPSGWTVVNDGEESGDGLTFPVTLVDGDNGQLGIDLFNYLIDKYGRGYYGEIEEDVFIPNNKGGETKVIEIDITFSITFHGEIAIRTLRDTGILE